MNNYGFYYLLHFRPLKIYNSPEDQDISASACTIDELELLTGLDFYHNLDEKTEKRVEASIDWKYWKGVGIY